MSDEELEYGWKNKLLPKRVPSMGVVRSRLEEEE